MRTSRRFHLLLPLELEAELRSFAGTRGLSLAEALRLLAVAALRAEVGETSTGVVDSPAALAGLTAAEHAVLMVASVLPEGQRRMRELSPAAASAAAERLALFKGCASE
jgi:hypothetical protein